MCSACQCQAHRRGPRKSPCRRALTSNCSLRQPRVWTQKNTGFLGVESRTLGDGQLVSRMSMVFLFFFPQCANPLVDLTSQEDCCGSVGTFWGVASCAPCPPRPGEYQCQDGGLRGKRSIPIPHHQGPAIFPDVSQGASSAPLPST